MGVSLGQAAKLTGKGKTTLTRAIQAGRLSATRRADGGYEIDPAELARVYEIRIETPETAATVSATVHHETASRDPETVSRLAAMEAELKGLKELLAEVRQSRDDWKGQAERLALAPPAPRQSWWRRLVG